MDQPLSAITHSLGKEGRQLSRLLAFLIRLDHTQFCGCSWIGTKYELEDEVRLDLKARILDVFFYHDVDSSGMEDDPVLGPIYEKVEQIEADRNK